MTKPLQTNKRLAALLIALFMGASGTTALLAQNITFADSNVKTICVANWDSNGDGELSYAEASAVTTLNSVFFMEDISSFDELQYFTGLSAIDGYEFYYCSNLASISLPPTVSSIGESAFEGCMSLATITSYATTPPTAGVNAFSGVPASAVVHVPCGSENYQTANGWSGFSNYEEFDAGYICFADTNVKAICVTHWDTNGDGELSYDEAAAVSYLGSVFKDNDQITSFNELQYFTGLTSIGNSAFSGCSGLTSIEIPNSVTSIGKWAFEGCRGLTSIEIPNSVTSIEDYAFNGCSGLTSVYYTGDVAQWCGISFGYYRGANPLSYGHNLYINNELVTALVIPSSVTSIGNAAFYGCIGLTSIEIPNSVTSIGSSAFSSCTGLTSIVIPNSVTSIGQGAFSSCTGLTSIEIPNSVTSIGNAAFSYCTGLTSIEIGNSVTSIGSSAFYGCYNLITIILYGTTPASLGVSVFNDVPSSTVINVPCGTSEAYQTASGWNVFTNYDEFVDENCPIDFADANVETLCVAAATGWDSNGDGRLSYAEAAAVTSLGTVFKGSSITSFGELVYFTALTSIPNQAFMNCSNLAFISIPEGIASLGVGAFFGCSVLATMYVYTETPPSVTNSFNNLPTSIHIYVPCGSVPAYQAANGWNSFTNYSGYGCDAIVFTDAKVKALCVTNWDVDGDGELSYPEAVAITDLGTVFENKAFLTSFNELQYFTGLTSIGNSAFYGCIGLTSIVIPSSVTSIGNAAFYGCIGLTSIEIPNSVTSIGYQAFYNCSGLTSIVVAEDNTVYDSRDNCNALIETATNTLIAGCKNTVIPNSVTSIGNYAFRNCTSLTSVEIPNSVTSIGNYAFRNCTSLTSVEIPNSVTSIGNYAFRNCTGLTSVEIPNSVTSIGGGAFYECFSLTSVEIPNSVTSIGGGAFYGCTGLTEITMLRTDVPSLSYSVFDYTNDCPIYVPYKSLNNYKTASNWSNYASRIYPMAYTAVSGYSEGGGKWAFIASPLTDDTEPTAVSNMTGTAYDLYRFNQSAELEWENYKANSFSSLANGQGYLYANKEDVNLVFKGTFNEEETQEVGLVYDEGKEFAGWNLVGNPFPVQAYANRSYYTMNEEGTGIEPTAASTSTAIPACTGVMVKAETTGQSVTFSKTAPSAATNNGALQIAVAQANTRGAAVQDKAIVSFNAGDELGKFYFGESNAKLYIPQNDKELAIAYVCTDAARHVSTNEVPLNFKAEKNGEYTLSVNPEGVEMSNLHLIDNMTGADVNLLQTNEYTFTGKTTDYTSRFRLVFSANESDGDNDGDNAFAYVDAGGNIVITADAHGASLQVIDVMGRVVRCTDGVHTVSTQSMAPGVYVLRLINGNDVMTQKMVIE